MEMINIKFQRSWLTHSRLDPFFNELKKFGQFFKIAYLPKKIKKMCVIRSPHINKSSREQFEQRISKVTANLSFEKLASLDLLLNQQCVGNMKYY